MCINVLQHALQNFTVIFLFFFFWQNFEVMWGGSFIAIWKSRLNALPYSEGHKSSIIADKLMKFAGHLDIVVLIKGCWNNLISDKYFFSSCVLKIGKTTMTLSGACTLLLHYDQMGWLTQKLWTICSNSPKCVHKYAIRLALSCIPVALWPSEIDKNLIFVFRRPFSRPYMVMWDRWYSCEISTIGKSSSNTRNCNKTCFWDSCSSIDVAVSIIVVF